MTVRCVTTWYKEQRIPLTLTPYLHFRGNTRDAMEFYHSVFGGALNVQTFKDAHASQDPSDDDRVMHAQLDGDHGLVLMASDPPARMQDELGKRLQTTSARSHPC